MAEFDYLGAKKAGASDEEIQSFLKANGTDFDLVGAKKAGATDDEISSFLNSQPVKKKETTQVGGQTSKPGTSNISQSNYNLDLKLPSIPVNPNNKALEGLGKPFKPEIALKSAKDEQKFIAAKNPIQTNFTDYSTIINDGIKGQNKFDNTTQTLTSQNVIPQQAKKEVQQLQQKQQVLKDSRKDTHQNILAVIPELANAKNTDEAISTILKSDMKNNLDYWQQFDDEALLGNDESTLNDFLVSKGLKNQDREAYLKEQASSNPKYGYEYEYNKIGSLFKAVKQRADDYDAVLKQKFGDNFMDVAKQGNVDILNDEDFNKFRQLREKQNELSTKANGLINDGKYAEVKKSRDDAERVQSKVDKAAKEDKWYNPDDELNYAANKLGYAAGHVVKMIAELPALATSIDKGYDWTDKLADWGNRFSDNLIESMPVSTDKKTGVFNKVADVDGYKVFVDESGEPIDVRDKNNFKVPLSVSQSVIEKFSSNPESYKTRNERNFGALADNGLNTMIDMGIMILGTKGAGMVGAGEKLQELTSMGIAYQQTKRDVFNDAIKKGLDPRNADLLSNIIGVAAGTSSMINPMEFNIAKGAGLFNLLKTDGLNAAKLALIKDGKLSVKDYAKEFVSGAIKNTIGEYIEESGIENTTQAISNNYFNNQISETDMVDGGLDDKLHILDKQGLETFLITAGSSFLMTPIEINSQTQFNQQEAMKMAIENPEDFAKIKELQLKQGQISQQQFDNETKIYNDVSKTYNAVKDDVKEELQSQLLALLTKKSNLSNKISEIKDEVLSKPYKDQLEQVNKGIESISIGKNADKSLVAPIEQSEILAESTAKDGSSTISKTETAIANKINKGQELTAEETDYYNAQKDSIDKLVTVNKSPIVPINETVEVEKKEIVLPPPTPQVVAPAELDEQQITEQLNEVLNDKATPTPLVDTEQEQNISERLPSEYQNNQGVQQIDGIGQDVSNESEVPQIEQEQEVAPIVNTETKVVTPTATPEILEEIKSKNLTHVRGKNMGENQSLGTFISTEKGNRYETADNKAESVEVDIKNPLVVENDLGLVGKRTEILNDNKDQFTKEDTVDYQELPNGKITLDDLNDVGIKKLAKITTEKLQADGYDGIYFKESKTQEGELVVFDKEKVKFKEQTSIADEKPKLKAKEKQDLVKSLNKEQVKEFIKLKTPQEKESYLINLRDKEQKLKNDKHDRLVSLMREYNSTPSNRTTRKQEIRQSMLKLSSDLGYSIKAKEGDKLEVLNSNGKLIRKINIPIDEKPATAENIEKVKELTHWFNWNGNDLDFHIDAVKLGLTWQNIRTALADINAGKTESTNINRVANAINEYGNMESLPLVRGFGGNYERLDVTGDDLFWAQKVNEATELLSGYEYNEAEREQALKDLSETDEKEFEQYSDLYSKFVNQDGTLNWEEALKYEQANKTTTDKGAKGQSSSNDISDGKNSQQLQKEKRSAAEIKSELKIKEAELKKLEEKQSQLNKQLEQNLKENQLDLLQGAKPQAMFDDKVEQQKIAEKSKSDIENKRKEIAKLNEELDNINQGEIPFQSTDKKFTTISQSKFNQLLDKLKKAFPNVKVELFGKSDFDNARKELEKRGIVVTDTKTKDGTIYGFKTPDGKVFLNSDAINANTPIHEFGHVWQSVFPNEFAKGISLLVQSPQGRELINEIRKNPAYKGKSITEIQAEALVTAIGNKGETIFNSNHTLYNKFKQWLNDLFAKIGDKLGIKNLSPDDKFDMFTKKVVGELLGGKVLDSKVGTETKSGDVDLQFQPDELTKKVQELRDFELTDEEIRDYLLEAGNTKQQIDDALGVKEVEENKDEVKKELSDSKQRVAERIVLGNSTLNAVKEHIVQQGYDKSDYDSKQIFKDVDELINKFGIEKAESFIDKIGDVGLSEPHKVVLQHKIAEYYGNKALSDENLTEEERKDAMFKSAQLFLDLSKQRTDAGRGNAILAQIYLDSDIYFTLPMFENKMNAIGAQLSGAEKIELENLQNEIKELRKENTKLQELAKKEAEQQIVDDITTHLLVDDLIIDSKIKDDLEVKNAKSILAKGFEDIARMLSSIAMAQQVDKVKFKDTILDMTKATMTISKIGVKKALKSVIKAIKNANQNIDEKLLEDAQKHVLSQIKETDTGIKKKNKEGISKDELIELIEQGADTMEKMVEAIRNKYYDGDKSISDKQIRDEITNYGNSIRQSQTQVEEKLSEIKSLMLLQSKLEDAENNVAPKKTGFIRDKDKIAVREKRRELAEAMKKLTVTLSEDDIAGLNERKLTQIANKIEEVQKVLDGYEKIKNKANFDYNDAVKKKQQELDDLMASQKALLHYAKESLTNLVAKYQDKLDKKQYSKNPTLNKLSITDGEYQKLKNQLEAKKEQLKSERDNFRNNNADYLLENRQKQIDRQIVEIDNLLAGIKVRKTSEQIKAERDRKAGIINSSTNQTALDKLKENQNQLEAKKEQWERKIIQKEVEIEKAKQTWLQKLGINAMSISRTLTLGFTDIGWLGVQGGYFARTKPHLFAKALKESFKGKLSEEAFNQWKRDLKSNPFYETMIKAGLRIPSQSLRDDIFEQEFRESGFTKLLGKNEVTDIVNKNGRLSVKFLANLRIQVFQKMYNGLTDSQKADKEVLEKLADYVNSRSGAGQVIGEDNKRGLNKWWGLLTSARNTSAMLQQTYIGMLYGLYKNYDPKKPITNQPLLRRQIINDTLNQAVLFSGLYLSYLIASGLSDDEWEIETSPFSTGFLKLKNKDGSKSYFDMGGMTALNVATLRLLTTITNALGTNIDNYKDYDDTYSKIGEKGSKTGLQVLSESIFNRTLSLLAPIKNAFIAKSGNDGNYSMYGQKYTPTEFRLKMLMDMIIPMNLPNIYNDITDKGVGGLNVAVNTILNVIGISNQNQNYDKKEDSKLPQISSVPVNSKPIVSRPIK